MTIRRPRTGRHTARRSSMLADRGSRLAADVISEGAGHLAALVGQLRNRGAAGSDVVVAGSVIVKQTRLFDAFKVALAGTIRGLRSMFSAFRRWRVPCFLRAQHSPPQTNNETSNR